MTPDDLDSWIFGEAGNWSAELAALVESVRPQFGEWFVEGGEAGMDRLHAAASFMVSNPEIQTQLDAYTFKFAAQVGGTFAQDLRDTLKEGLDSGESAAQLRKRVIAAGHGTISDYKAAMIARRESVNAMEMGAHEAYRQQGVPATVWRAGPSACEFCVALDGKVISINSTFANVGDTVNVDVDGKQRAFKVGYENVSHPPLHPFCLPGDAEVTPCGRISAYSERWYDGEVVVIGTARGYDLTLTPNHPVLTPDGWVAAGLLDIGSSVISVPVRKRIASAYKKGQQMPARIEDIADALRRSGNMPAIQVPLAAKDFHGDGAGSKVAVIGANRQLRSAGDATRLEHAHKLPFSLAYIARSVLPCLGALDKARKRDGRATDGIVRSLRQPLALLRRSLSHTDKHGLALIAGGNASSQDYAPDNSARYSKRFGKGFLGLAADVAGDNLCIGQVPRLASLDSGGIEFAGDAPPLTVEFGSDVRDRLPVGVTADEIVSVKRAAFHGMVYNLETESGFYVANGIISHNCRCSADPVELEDLADAQAAAPADPVTPGGVTPAPKPEAVESVAQGYRAARHTSLDAFDLDAIERIERHTDEDMWLRAIYSQQGFDDLPRLVSQSEMDKLDTAGARILYRGIQDRTFCEQLQTGEHYAGAGVYGNGTYTAYGPDGLDIASLFKGWSGKGGILRMTLAPEARVITESQLSELFYAAQQASASGLSMVARDQGRFAAMLGYDAIDVESRQFMVVLNRTALIIQDAIL